MNAQPPVHTSLDAYFNSLLAEFELQAAPNTALDRRALLKLSAG